MNTQQLIEYVKEDARKQAELEIEHEKIQKAEKRRHKLNKLRERILDYGMTVCTIAACLCVLAGVVLIVLFISDVYINPIFLKWGGGVAVIITGLCFFLAVLNNSLRRF